MELPIPVRASRIFSALSILLLSSTAAAQSSGGLSLEVMIGDPTATESATSPLEQGLEGLASSDPEERLAAVRALGELRDPAAVGPLSNTARTDPRPEIRGWALRALQRIGTQEALDTIHAVGENDSDERVRTLAASLVGPIAPPPQVAEAPADPEPVEAPPAQPQGQGIWEIPPPSTSPSVQTNIVIQTGRGQDLVPPRLGPAPVAAPAPVYDYRAQMIEARRLRRAGLGLRIAGWTVFGLTYVPAFIAGLSIGSEDDDGWSLIVPVFGPIIAGARIFDDEVGESHNGLGILSVVWGLLQAAGLAMAIGGHVRRRRARRQAALSGVGQERPQRQISVLPGGSGDGLGLAVAATF